MSEKNSLDEKLLDDYKNALRSRIKIEIACLRLIRSEIKNKEIQKRNNLNDEEIIQLLNSHLKKEQESLDFFIKGERKQLEEQTREEIAIIERYLPKKLSSKEIEVLARNIIDQNKFMGIKDFGLAMKLVMNETKGRSEGSLVNQIVKNILQAKQE